MQVNMYSTPAEAQFINTYAPVDFNDLYRIATTQAQMVQDTQDKLAQNLQKFGEFQSLSDVDTKRYYDLTIGSKPIQDILNETVKNPDSLKDAAFRSRINSAINNIDYESLSRLRQSNEQMKVREQANRQLALNGLYNPEWHNVDFANYDTYNKGIFSDTTPIAYQSIVDMVKPYVDNLKPEFISNKNGWITNGVSTDRTDMQVNTNISSIINTPQYQKHKQQLINRGFTDKQADEQLYGQILLAGREFAYENSERDPWWMKQQELAIKARQKAMESGTSGIAGYIKNLTALAHNNARRNYLDVYAPGLTQEEKNAYMAGGIEALPKDKQQYISNALNPENIKKLSSDVYKQTVANSGGNINAGIYKLMQMNGVQTGIDANDIFSSNSAVSGKDGIYTMNTSSNLLLLDDLMLGSIGSSYVQEKIQQMGKDAKEKDIKKVVDLRYKFDNDWVSGKFKNFKIQGEPTAVRVGKAYGNTYTDFLYHPKFAYVPIEQFEKNGYEEKDIQKLGFDVVNQGEISQTISLQADKDNTDDPTKTTISTRNNTSKYVVVPTATRISDNGLEAMNNDYSYMINQKIGTKNNFNQTALSQFENE